MNTYSYCDISLESEIELPGLRVSTADAPDVIFRVDAAGNSLIMDSAWRQAELGEGGFVSCAVKPGTDLHCLIFENIASFEIRNGFSKITCHPEPSTTLNSIHHLLLDQVLPRVLSARGKLMMHGSCIEHPKGAIVFAGVSGVGKSTLAAHFSRRGFPLLSDDGLQLKLVKGNITVIPTYPGLRLWDDSIEELFDGAPSSEPIAHYSSKKRIESEKFLHLEELPAMCLFFIRHQIHGDLPSITRIVNREAFFELNKQVFILDPFSREKAISRINAIAELVSNLPMYDLVIPHDYSMLDQVQKSVLELVGTL
jgi:hypothetical protein